MAPDANRIETPLRQEAFELSPESQRELSLSSEIAWSFSILMGRAGSVQVPLACSKAGALAVDDATAGTGLATLHTDLDTTIAGKLTSTNDAKKLADYFDSVVSAEPLFYGGLSLAYDLQVTRLLLEDVYDGVNHYLRTHETA